MTKEQDTYNRSNTLVTTTIQELNELIESHNGVQGLVNYLETNEKILFPVAFFDGTMSELDLFIKDRDELIDTILKYKSNYIVVLEFISYNEKLINKDNFTDSIISHLNESFNNQWKPPAGYTRGRIPTVIISGEL